MRTTIPQVVTGALSRRDLPVAHLVMRIGHLPPLRHRLRKATMQSDSNEEMSVENLCISVDYMWILLLCNSIYCINLQKILNVEYTS
jgi:hypothetical protein